MKKIIFITLIVTLLLTSSVMASGHINNIQVTGKVSSVPALSLGDDGVYHLRFKVELYTGGNDAGIYEPVTMIIYADGNLAQQGFEQLDLGAPVTVIGQVMPPRVRFVEIQAHKIIYAR